jgi:hypothetical protein
LANGYIGRKEIGRHQTLSKTQRKANAPKGEGTLGSENMSLGERLERYLRNHHARIASGDLHRIVAEKNSYSPQNVGRRLRELAEQRKMKVMYVRDHAHCQSAQSGGRNSALEGGLLRTKLH